MTERTPLTLTLPRVAWQNLATACQLAARHRERSLERERSDRADLDQLVIDSLRSTRTQILTLLEKSIP